MHLRVPRSSLPQAIRGCWEKEFCSLMGSMSQGCRSRLAFTISYMHIFSLGRQASADKIIREMEMFGPDFEKFHQEILEEKEKPSSPNTSAAVGKATKGKIAAKATGHTYQFQIMESIGVPRSEIKKFADPYHWLTYFPPICIVSRENPFPGVVMNMFVSGGSQVIWFTYRLAPGFHDNRC